MLRTRGTERDYEGQRSVPRRPSSDLSGRPTLLGARVHRRGCCGADDSGVTLILALVFLLAVGLLLVVLASTTGADLLNSTNLRGQRSIEYSADGVTTIAAQNARYSGNPYSSSPTDCLPNGGSMSINGVVLAVYCTQQLWDPISGVTRVINLYACHSGTCSSANAVLQAQVTYDDYSVSNEYHCQYGGATSTCGTAMTIDSWILETANN